MDFNSRAEIVGIPGPCSHMYRIALNFGGAKLRRIWRNAFLSPNISLQSMHDDSRKVRFVTV